MFRSTLLRAFLDKVPGKNTFGVYRFLPFFFLLGATVEFAMIKWEANNKVNFYDTYKKRRAEEIAQFIIAARSHAVGKQDSATSGSS